MSYLMYRSGGVTRYAIGDYECNSHVPLVDFVKLVDTRGRRRGSRWFLCGVVGERGFGLARRPQIRRSVDSESRMLYVQRCKEAIDMAMNIVTVVVRPAVLRSLGWRTMRVWSTEWVRDPAKVVERIEAAAAGG
jgi:hypothetical protein